MAASTAAVSKKPFMAVGVAMTPTCHSRSCAAVISLPTSAAIPAAHTTTYKKGGISSCSVTPEPY